METDKLPLSTATELRWMPLRCGPLTLHFDPETASLRRIRFGADEVVRAIYVAVRDRNWDTITPHLTNLRVETDTDGFHISFDAPCRKREIDFVWHGEIVGGADGILRFSMEGMAQTSFWRNRIGFCVLHPIRECAGQPCRVTLQDGSTLQTAFPAAISPHQPFLNMRAITHTVATGIEAEVAFEGDTFEMEDQRNWTDASFKTYCTPLERPYPVEIPAGARITQSVTLRLKSEDSGPIRTFASEETSTPVTLRRTDGDAVPLPAIGLGIASHGNRLSERERRRLWALVLSHLRLDLPLAQPDWETKLSQATEEARSLLVGLEIALFLSKNVESELAALAEAVKRLRSPVRRWLVFSAETNGTTGPLLRQARQHLAPVTPTAQIGGGTNANFAELNRQRPPLEFLDCVCYAMNPQVHAFDTPTLMENVEAQGETVRSARLFSGKLPIIVSPVTLKPRFNPNATGSVAPTPPDELPAPVDPRQCTLLGAAWTLGSLKSLCESRVQSVTYFETTGWRGLMERKVGPSHPEQFPSVAGAVFPIYHVFAQIAPFFGGSVLPLEASEPLKVTCLALQNGERNAILCANLTAEPQSVWMALPTTATDLDLWRLDTATEDGTTTRLQPEQSGNAEEPEQQSGITLDLAPFAMACLKWRDEENV